MHRQHVYYGIAALILIAIVLATSNGQPSLLTTTSSSGFDSAVKDFSVRTTDSDHEEVMYSATADSLMMAPEISLGATAAEVEQRIIKTATVTLEVDAAAEAATAISTIAQKHGGFVESSSVQEEPNGSKSGWITIRIPAHAFTAAIEETKALADKVMNESTNAQDVTEHYTDLEARLHAAEAQEQQYLTVLTQAKSVGDILTVQEHLAEVRAEIESLQGQINYLENRTAYSSISVSLIEESRVTIPAEKYDLLDEMKDAVRLLIITAQNILTSIIWTIIVGGPFALLAYAGYRGYRAWQRRQ